MKITFNLQFAGNLAACSFEVTFLNGLAFDIDRTSWLSYFGSPFGDENSVNFTYSQCNDVIRMASEDVLSSGGSIESSFLSQHVTTRIDAHLVGAVVGDNSVGVTGTILRCVLSLSSDFRSSYRRPSSHRVRSLLLLLNTLSSDKGGWGWLMTMNHLCFRCDYRP